MSALTHDRVMWMKGHRAMARRLLGDSRITDAHARAVIKEHFDFVDAWVADCEADHALATASSDQEHTS